jgi:hypothetical protein
MDSLLPVVAVVYFVERRKQRKADAMAYQKLSNQNRQIIDTVLEAGKIRKSTLQTIIAFYRSKTGKSIDKEEMLQRLSEAERTGIVERGVASVQDEPTQVWKGLLSPKRS